MATNSEISLLIVSIIGKAVNSPLSFILAVLSNNAECMLNRSEGKASLTGIEFRIREIER